MGYNLEPPEPFDYDTPEFCDWLKDQLEIYDKVLFDKALDDLEDSGEIDKYIEAFKEDRRIGDD